MTPYHTTITNRLLLLVHNFIPWIIRSIKTTPKISLTLKMKPTDLRPSDRTKGARLIKEVHHYLKQCEMLTIESLGIFINFTFNCYPSSTTTEQNQSQQKM
jgi:hypothetical protein